MKISIITATFNSSSTIKYTLDSVLTQTFTDIEYIVIDGKSKDNTVDIVKKYESKFAGRLKYISEPDKGIYDAMNKGIKIATGDVIGILNSDDFYTSNDVLQTIAETFENNKIDAIYGDIHFVNDNDLTKCVRYYSSKIFKRKYMRMGFMPAHPSFYVKKSVYEKYGLYKTDYKITADFEFLLRSVFVGKIKTKYVNKDMVTMRTGGASTAGFNARKLIMKEHLRAFKENNVYTNVIILSLRYIYKITEYFNNRF